MNILVCAKQVPDTTEIKIDPETNTLIRKGVPSILNTYDAYALELALKLKDKDKEGTRIVVISMGPPQAEAILKEALSVGADAVYLISDRAFGGSDTLATSYILSRAIATLERTEGTFDLILCGKQAIDGDTAQVGPEIAEHMDYPQVTYAVALDIEGDHAVVRREGDTGYEIVHAQLPAVITVTKTAELRFPSIMSKMKALKAEVPMVTLADVEIDVSMIGLKGSPTRVVKTFTPTLQKNGVILDFGEHPQAPSDLATILSDAKII